MVLGVRSSVSVVCHWSLGFEFKEQMEAIAVPWRGPLCWGDFAWLDEPTPVPSDTVIEPPADPLLSAICKGALISDRSFFWVGGRWVGASIESCPRQVLHVGRCGGWVPEL